MPTNIELLQQIQEATLSSKGAVSDALRRTKLLAARIELPDLEAWVNHELNGYGPDVHLPDYRIVDTHATGHFVGQFGSGIRNAPLPASNMPEELRDWARKALRAD